MSKRIIANLLGSSFSSTAESMYVELSEEMACKIHQMSQLVTENDGYSMTLMMPLARWSTKCIDENADGSIDFDAAITEIDANPAKMDCRDIEITQSEFRFTACPEEAGEDERHSTDWISIDQLPNFKELYSSGS